MSMPLDTTRRPQADRPRRALGNRGGTAVISAPIRQVLAPMQRRQHLPGREVIRQRRHRPARRPVPATLAVRATSAQQPSIPQAAQPSQPHPIAERPLPPAATRAARARRATRNVPIPPELVRLLREHIEMFGTGPGGRLFRSENGNPIQPSTYWRVWQKARGMALTPAQLATPLMRRPYDLRHSGVTWRLNSSVPATEVAAWAGHNVEVLMRVYARCVVGLEDVWIARMDAALRPGGDPPQGQAPPGQAAGDPTGQPPGQREEDGNEKGEGPK